LRGAAWRVILRVQVEGATRPADTEEKSMQLSARNQLRGTVVEVTKGQTTSDVRIDVWAGPKLTASITNEAVDELKLTKGMAVYAIIKASDVMVGTD
jgi:molybdopterin-binding protein